MPTRPSLVCPRESLSPRPLLSALGLTARDFVPLAHWAFGCGGRTRTHSAYTETLQRKPHAFCKCPGNLGAYSAQQNREYAAQGIVVPEPSQARQNDRVATVWLQATLCAERAERASRDDERGLFIYLRNSWIEVANDIQFADGLRSGAASYAARRDAA
jgi:hypothetical protein